MPWTRDDSLPALRLGIFRRIYCDLNVLHNLSTRTSAVWWRHADPYIFVVVGLFLTVAAYVHVLHLHFWHSVCICGCQVTPFHLRLSGATPVEVIVIFLHVGAGVPGGLRLE